MIELFSISCLGVCLVRCLLFYLYCLNLLWLVLDWLVVTVDVYFCVLLFVCLLLFRFVDCVVSFTVLFCVSFIVAALVVGLTAVVCGGIWVVCFVFDLIIYVDNSCDGWVFMGLFTESCFGCSVNLVVCLIVTVCCMRCCYYCFDLLLFRLCFGWCFTFMVFV